MIFRILFYLSIALFTTSCASNYVVSNNSYAPTKTTHLTSNGLEIPKAKVSYKNSFKITKELEKTIEEVEVPDSEVIVNHNFITNLLEDAKTYIGPPYRYGGTTRKGIDCSAFTQQVFEKNGIEIPRVAAAQALQGEYISKQELQIGDLVFFSRRGKRISHVGIVESINEENGEIYFIHASTSKGVVITPLSNSYWSPKFKYGKRVI